MSTKKKGTLSFSTIAAQAEAQDTDQVEEGARSKVTRRPVAASLLGDPKGSKTISTHFRPIDEPHLLVATRELSPFIDPISLANLIEAVMVATRDHRELANRLREQLPHLKEEALYTNTTRKSTVRVNNQVLSYLRKVVDPADQRALTLFIRWIASDWQTIRGYFHTYGSTR